MKYISFDLRAHWVAAFIIVFVVAVSYIGGARGDDIDRAARGIALAVLVGFGRIKIETVRAPKTPTKHL